jgi:hypothetical protein
MWRRNRHAMKPSQGLVMFEGLWMSCGRWAARLGQRLGGPS